MNFFLPAFFLSLFGFFTVLDIRHDLLFSQGFYFFSAFFSFFFVKKYALFFRKNWSFFFWAAFFLLIITFIIGLETRGSRRWLNFYFFNFQASEFLKVFFIFYLADILTREGYYIDQLKNFVKAILTFLIIVFLIFKQPDLGNAIIFSLIFLIMLLNSAIPKKIIFNFIVLAFLLLPGLWFFLKDYQKQRIVAFLNPHIDYQGTSYNMIQSIISVGSGGFFGRGLGFGTQSKLRFLPENHTDFIFASLVEQFGFFGGFMVLILYGLLFYFLTKKALFFLEKKSESENFLIVIGIIAYFFFQMVINIGMNMGIMPVTGIVLPFISYGGSAFLSSFILLALIP